MLTVLFVVSFFRRNLSNINYKMGFHNKNLIKALLSTTTAPKTKTAPSSSLLS
eukprot:GDKH01008275.1.p1 GENE.GDKH01008275.1~~GDKH01008275.1.p1  ORF type:complete len:53 (-),score=2.83 GDKH01008275.1:103-261(-)